MRRATAWKITAGVIIAIVLAALSLILFLHVILPLPESTTIYPRQNPNSIYQTSYLFGYSYNIGFNLPGYSDAKVDDLRKKVSISIEPSNGGFISDTDGGLMDANEHFFFYLKPKGIRKLRITFHFSDTEQWPEKLEVTLYPPSL